MLIATGVEELLVAIVESVATVGVAEKVATVGVAVMVIAPLFCC